MAQITASESWRLPIVLLALRKHLLEELPYHMFAACCTEKTLLLSLAWNWESCVLFQALPLMCSGTYWDLLYASVSLPAKQGC